MIKVPIAEDHAIFPEGLKNILGNSSEIAVADEARNRQEVLNLQIKDVCHETNSIFSHNRIW